MCGIAGIAGDIDGADLVRKMMAAIAHRGPDDQGVAAQPGMVFGHTRLAIVDLSRAAAQPMTSRDGRWTIVLNGEIFNYPELRRQLGPLPWRSASDTEVLLEACASWGVEDAVERAVGMFAFALWDAEARELTLVRDRVGEKPLVYFEGVQHGWPFIAFASEVKALAAFHSSRIDPAAADIFFALGYVPAPLAIFEGTRKLQAGHLLRWKNGKTSVRRWWLPEKNLTGDRSAPQAPAGFQESRTQLRALVRDSVGLRMRSDVPLALALSGGLDSSVIAAEMVRLGGSPRAFTVVFDGEEADLAPARHLASRLGLRHEIVGAESGNLPGRLSQAMATFDEPFADSSSLPALALAEALAGRFKVILNGDGGDEAFAGYPHYEFVAAKQRVKAFAAHAGLMDGRGRTGVYVQSKSIFKAAERLLLLRGGGGPAAQLGSGFGSAPGAAGNAAPVPPLQRLLEGDSYHQAAPSGALKHALWSDRHLYLANDLTYKMDLALASRGVEGRAPLLDHRILEWTQNLPEADLVRGRQKKVLLRQAYREDLTPEIADRPKHGFGAPVGRWLAGPLRELVRDLVPHPLLAPEVQRRARGQQLWTLLAFVQWARHWKAWR